MMRIIQETLPVRCLLKYPIEKFTWTLNIQYIPTATQVFREKSHNCCSKVGANESDVDDDNSEKDKLLAKYFLPDIYGLPSRNVEVFSLGQHSKTRDIQNTGYVDKWFDAGEEFIIALEYKCGVSLKELHSNDDKVRISESIVSPKFVWKVLEQAIVACEKARGLKQLIKRSK
ncbi:hypothetical protein MTR67_035974 [Solanum verrucosum]|uniref:Uncharacterized protein n=1 Tax=Solanum verrucosum TaxID=315347 RepID=A0AAF0ZMT1_SOLVR|nr:hypothetical protein MTR67_035974 [Solanum verrucosum]